jgi:hypothetical protein
VCVFFGEGGVGRWGGGWMKKWVGLGFVQQNEKVSYSKKSCGR